MVKGVGFGSKDLGIEEFLDRHSGMSRAPVRASGVRLSGEYRVHAHMDNFPTVDETYQLDIECASNRIGSIQVLETGSKIPQESEYHVNPDGSLCLGSPISLQMNCGGSCASLSVFAEKCITPFLYSITLVLEGYDFPYGELPHGKEGLFVDYMAKFGANNKRQVVSILESLAKKKRVANKRMCPLGCGVLLGKCAYRNELNRWRTILPRSSFREELRNFDHELRRWKEEERKYRERRRKKVRSPTM